MNKVKAIRNIVIKKTEFLHEFGYSKTKEKSDIWNYTLSYISESREFAIEFEIDYRDLDMFVLVAILGNGELPGGYYMNKGKRVRIHLEKLFESGKITNGNWKAIPKLRRELKNTGETRILSLLDAYCQLIKEVMNEIQNLSVSEL
ncbi:MAG: hypothetical protein ACOY35_09780 [Bacillota bacterium]